jgi:S1-C subfamily serine protease
MKNFTRITTILVVSAIVFISVALLDNKYKFIQLQSEKDGIKSTSDLQLLKLEQKIADLEKVDEGIINNQETSEQAINQVAQTVDDVIVDNEKPSYTYLKSVTVYINGVIAQKQLDDGSLRVKQSWAGTGSIIKVDDEYTYILTNAHVSGKGLEPVEEIELTVKDEIYGKIKAEVVKQSDYVDLAVIRVKGKLSSKQAIKGYGTVKQQDKIYSCGNYLGMEYIYTEGSVAGYTTEERFEDPISLIVNMPSAFGCSGSAVVNQKGELIGVVYAIFQVGYMGVDTSKAIVVEITNVKEFIEQAIGGN